MNILIINAFCCKMFSPSQTPWILSDSFNYHDSTNIDFNVELANDIISIIHHFSMKLYSNRRSKLKEIEKIIKEGNN